MTIKEISDIEIYSRKNASVSRPPKLQTQTPSAKNATIDYSNFDNRLFHSSISRTVLQVSIAAFGDEA